MARVEPRPLGSVHPRECCYFCGSRDSLQEKVLVAVTRAEGWKCVDNVACLRRKRRETDAQQEKLFMRNPRNAA
jgi:alpha-D-ribose 1-methylphosphonate 5-phosphate C-P lyase